MKLFIGVFPPESTYETRHSSREEVCWKLIIVETISKSKIGIFIRSEGSKNTIESFIVALSSKLKTCRRAFNY